MNPFSYSRPDSVAGAIELFQPHSRYIAGGTNLLDLMKETVLKPAHLIDITRLPLQEVSETAQGGLRIGALVSNSELAWHPLVRERYPLLSEAILAGASPQLRNKATTGGNLLQRTRCHYFYDSTVPCNKREPGTGCPARTGLNRMHAILGHSKQCIAVHPSDMCVALAALEAEVIVRGPGGERRVAFADFHRLPGDAPERDNSLEEGELILAVELGPDPHAAHSRYLKTRDRASYAFALVSVAAALAIDAGRIQSARIALGGVAHKPWRMAEAEQQLLGQPPEPSVFGAAADVLLRGAEGFEHNQFKIELARRAIIVALTDAARGTRS